MEHYMLVTDDDQNLLSLYHHLFAKYENLSIDYADSPAACRELLAQRKYDLALLDISLGDSMEDGLTLLDTIRLNSPETDVLMMSTMDSDATIAECLSHGARTFASKNRDFPRHLRHEVEDLLQLRPDAATAPTAGVSLC